ncbi:MAG: hypoxanthine phosphoribosyltransferase [Deltaproteobacteria bacterium CG2_30_63_29]|nr:MAG: hypoxanthine phosphoribosyltransferase [Deltaproteobacteria bacterium CG2_30_63_29]PJB34793.1 MAG: hypoxanthine phosphoribosyltransferase [Deltaproteobacteria bacterium CG_4_9_14_3_um_filter_63_12]
MKSLEQYEEFITPLITEAEIMARCAALGAQLTEDYRDKDVVVVGILKGVIPFYADLLKHIRLPLCCDFLGLSSYGSRTETSGVVRLTSDLSKPVNNRHVLILEDIVDSGLTMNFLMDTMRTRNPKSVKICSLLHKPDNEIVHVNLDYVGFVIPNHFVVGYGLDYDERFRNLPYIGYFAGEVPELSTRADA